jgi:hypothetical protein
VSERERERERERENGFHFFLQTYYDAPLICTHVLIVGRKLVDCAPLGFGSSREPDSGMLR